MHIIYLLNGMKAIFVLLSLFVALNVQAQNADARIGALMGGSRWFDLSHELNVTPTDSVNPLLHKMALAMTYHYFNQADSACIVLSDLLNNHQEELGENTLNMAVLLGMNLARTNHYTEAADLMQDLCTQLKAQGADSTQTIGLFTLVKQYRAFADNAPICLPLYQPGTYHIPMKTHNAMHIAKNGTEKGHFITMGGSINGQESPLVFDTGAGVNIISSAQANNYGLRLLDVSIPMMGVGMQQGRYAIADTLHIGDMAWQNVPFLIVDIQTNDVKVDSIGTLLPPVIGLPIMFQMQEIQLDFEHQTFIVPSALSQHPFKKSNLLRTDSESLLFTTTDEEGQPLYFHFDTGGYNTTLSPYWYKKNKDIVQTMSTPDSLRIAGVGGYQITRSYRLPHKKFCIGSGVAILDSVMVNTGIDLHSDEFKIETFLEDKKDGLLGLDVMERFKLVILNLRDMYLEAIPYQKE